MQYENRSLIECIPCNIYTKINVRMCIAFQEVLQPFKAFMFACYTIFYSWFASLFSDMKVFFQHHVHPFPSLMNMAMKSEATGYVVHFSLTISTQINIQHGWVRAISRNAYPLECIKSLKMKTSRRKQKKHPFQNSCSPNQFTPSDQIQIISPFFDILQAKKWFNFKKRHVTAAEEKHLLLLSLWMVKGHLKFQCFQWLYFILFSLTSSISLSPFSPLSHIVNECWWMRRKEWCDNPLGFV